MLSTSFAFRRHAANGGYFEPRAELTTADGTVYDLRGGDFVMGGASVSGSSSSMGSFDVGAAIVGGCELTLQNYDGQWDEVDFTGSTLKLWICANLEGGTESLRRGTYEAQQPESYGATIGLSCDDNMRLLKVPYQGVETGYPATLQVIAADICRHCGIEMESATFPRSDYVVNARPSGDGLTCLQVIAWVAQVACCFADADPYGRLRMRWYDTTAYEGEAWLDGGTYDTQGTPYSDGDTADGGGFMDGGDTADGGEFSAPRWAAITAISSLTTATDDVVITGVRVTAYRQTAADGTMGDEGGTVLYGAEGYVLEIADNPLIEYGRAYEAARRIGAVIVGMRFRPLNVSAIGDPAWEAGDPMLVTDQEQRTYRTWITSYTWKAGSYEELRCDAKTPARNRADSYSAQTRAIVEARNAIRAETSARRTAIRSLEDVIASSSGLFCTEQEQPDGSVIRYYHDKRTLAQSTIVWRFSANAFTISNDGGETYPYGIDVTGAAILDRIYTIGLDAEYINSGRVSFDGGGWIDFALGTMGLGGGSTIGGRTVQQTLSDVDSAGITQIEYGTSASSSAEPVAWSTTAPSSVSKGSWLWVRTTYKNNSTSVTKAYAGTDGQDGADGTGITRVEPQWYLSTSDSTQTGGSWSTTQPAWEHGKYLWTRSLVTWDTTPATTTTTDPVLAGAINTANENATTAQQNSARLAADTSTLQQNYAQLAESYEAVAREIGIVHDDLEAEVAEARRYASDYLTFTNGELIIGVTGTEIKNVLGATQQTYRTSAGDVAGYGMFNGIWEMFIETARIQNLLRFGSFAWIARDNGNMTLKWMGTA